MEKESEKYSSINDEQQGNYIIGEEKFSKFSKEIFQKPIFGYLSGIYLNYIYIYNWRKNKNIFSLLLILYINFLIIKIILKNVLKIKEVQDNKKNNDEILIEKRKEMFRKIISLENPGSTIRGIIYTYLCLILANLLGDKFIILFILNIFIFYSPINNKFPNFIFMSIMSVKQTIEGIIGIISCFIPRYIPQKEKNI